MRKAANLDRIGQVFVRLTGWQESLVYYPLWVLRYSYRGRSFQVVVDGFSGEVLYGKAPGSVFYRAAVLVGGRLGRPLGIRQGLGSELHVRPGPDGTVDVGGRSGYLEERPFTAA